MELTLRNTFAKISIHTYCFGTFVHIMRIIFRPPFDPIPNEAHGLVTILAGYTRLPTVFFHLTVILLEEPHLKR